MAPLETIQYRAAPNVEAPKDRSWLIAAAIAVGCHLVWYAADAIHGGFRNLDVAGIAYNARLLLEDGLPYVDSWEPKPPGTFFLFAAILSFGSMHAVWVVAIVWGAATSVATGLLAGRLWGKRFALPAAALHAGGTLVPTQADINYSFWATLPFVMATAMAFKAPEAVRRPWLHWGLVGGVAAIAVLMKQSAIGLLLILPLAVHLRAGTGWPERMRAAVFGTLGASLVFLAIALPWALAGETRALLVGLGLDAGWLADYTAAQTAPLGGVFLGLVGGVYFIAKVKTLGGLAAFLGLWGWPRRESDPPVWAYVSAVVFIVAAFAGMAATLRFYLHYLVQFWPALVVIALNPSGLFMRLLNRVAALGARPVFVCLLVATATTFVRNDLVKDLRVQRVKKDREVAWLCAALRPALEPDDPVLGWGWPSWGVYIHCERRAPGPVYKAMTLVTTPNTNTGWRRSDPMRLRPGPATDRYVSDFLAARPPLFLWSNGYSSYGSEPLVDLPQIHEVLDEAYIGLRLRRNFAAFIRRDAFERIEDPWLRSRERIDFDDVLEGQGLPRRSAKEPKAESLGGP